MPKTNDPARVDFVQYSIETNLFPILPYFFCFFTDSIFSHCYFLCSRSMTFWCGSADPCLIWIQIRIRILLFSSLTFKTPIKKLIFLKKFLLITFCQNTLHHFTKIKSSKEVTNQGIKVFLTIFA